MNAPKKEKTKSIDKRSVIAAVLNLILVGLIIFLFAVPNLFSLKTPLSTRDRKTVNTNIDKYVNNFFTRLSNSVEALDKADIEYIEIDGECIEISSGYVSDFYNKLKIDKYAKNIKSSCKIIAQGEYCAEDFSAVFNYGEGIVTELSKALKDRDIRDSYEAAKEHLDEKTADAFEQFYDAKSTVSGIPKVIYAVKVSFWVFFAVWVLLGVSGAILSLFRKAGALKHIFYAFTAILALAVIVFVVGANIVIGEFVDSFDFFGVRLTANDLFLKVTYAPITALVLAVSGFIFNPILLKRKKDQASEEQVSAEQDFVEAVAPEQNI